MCLTLNKLLSILQEKNTKQKENNNKKKPPKIHYNYHISH